jgi:hypothetical protein
MPHSHGGGAAAHLGKDTGLVDKVKRDFLQSPGSDKLKTLLVIAGQVQKGGKQVTAESVESPFRNSVPKGLNLKILLLHAF